MKAYILGSSAMVFAPGVVNWALNGYRVERDRETMANVIAKGWNIPLEAAHALLSGAAKHKVEGDNVVFKV